MYVPHCSPQMNIQNPFNAFTNELCKRVMYKLLKTWPAYWKIRKQARLPIKGNNKKLYTEAPRRQSNRELFAKDKLAYDLHTHLATAYSLSKFPSTGTSFCKSNVELFH